jgi:signal transduction histidine kinase
VKTDARFRPGLRLVFVGLGLLVLVLAGSGMVLFRAYDNQLIRATEAELYAQGAFVAARYRELLRTELAKTGAGTAFGHAVDERFRKLHGTPPQHVPAHLDLWTDPITPNGTETGPAEKPADAVSTAAGAALLPLIQQGTSMALSGIRVLDHQGVVVASSRGEMGFDRSSRQEVQRVLAGEFVSLLRARVSDSPAPPYSSISRSTGVRVLVGIPVVEQGQVWGAVMLSRTPMSLGKAFYQDRNNLLVMLGVLVVAVALVSALAAAFIVRPLRALIRQVRAVAAGDAEGTRPLARPGTREIHELTLSIATMAQELQKRADYVRGFVAAVSHEFKTPLAALRGTAEVLTDHGTTMDETQRTKFLANLDEDAKRLERQVQALLELARADMGAGSEETTDLLALLHDVESAAQGHRLALTVPSSLPRARIAPQALSAVLATVLGNARTHGGPNVELWVRADGDRLHIDIQDDGPGISPGHAARIFEPFFTTARERGGTGMGLTVARALLRTQGATIDLVPTVKGACFRVSLRAANA